MANSYNGYEWLERMAKFKEQQRRLAAKSLAKPEGPCRLCGDRGGAASGVTFEYHDEDYSREFLWTEPAAFVVCRDCHIYRIHQRFRYPNSWKVFLAHVARGGFAREMKLPEVQRELEQYRKALIAGAALPTLSERNEGNRDIVGAWFTSLTCDLGLMSARSYRPRP